MDVQLGYNIICFPVYLGPNFVHPAQHWSLKWNWVAVYTPRCISDHSSVQISVSHTYGLDVKWVTFWSACLLVLTFGTSLLNVVGSKLQLQVLRRQNLM
jgi:hypothetical protein